MGGWSCVAAAVLCAAGVSAAQPVQVGGYLEVRYDDVLTQLFVHGTDVTADTAQVNPGWHVVAPINASVNGDTMVIAATVRNGGYTGGLMININTNLGQAVTNSSWKWMLRPQGNWEQPNYNDGAWFPVYDQGSARETPGWVRDSSCVHLTDSCPWNVFDASGARFLWSDEDLFFRRTFNVDSACSATVWAGCRGSHIIYLDGAEVVRDSLWSEPIVVYDTLGNPDTTGYRPVEHSTGGRMYLSAGSHTLAISVLTQLPLDDGAGGALKVGVAKSIKVPQPIIEWDSLFNPDTVGWDTVIQLRPVLVCDTLWKVSNALSSGWADPSFNDASWWNAAIVNDQIYPVGYPGLTEFGAGFRTMWLPQTISFRGKVALSQLSTRPGAKALGAARRLEVGYASGRIAVRGTAGVAFRVDIYSPDGRRVFRSAEVRSGYCPVRCDGWARGSYVVRVSSGKSVITRPVTIMR